jgi:hypothetical protein
MVCVGLSCGTLAELAWTKWTPGPPVALVRGTMSRVPPEMLAEIPATVLDLAELPGWLGLPEAGQAGSVGLAGPADPAAPAQEPVR